MFRFYITSFTPVRKEGSYIVGKYNGKTTIRYKFMYATFQKESLGFHSKLHRFFLFLCNKVARSLILNRSQKKKKSALKYKRCKERNRSSILHVITLQINMINSEV